MDDSTAKYASNDAQIDDTVHRIAHRFVLSLHDLPGILPLSFSHSFSSLAQKLPYTFGFLSLLYTHIPRGVGRTLSNDSPLLIIHIVPIWEFCMPLMFDVPSCSV